MTSEPSTGKYPNQIVADNLAAELARKRISGRELARRLHLETSYVARRVNGSTDLTANDIVVFSDVLGISPAVLFEGTKKTPTPKGGGDLLPELDSNQQPAGNKPGDVLIFPNMTDIHHENEDETDAEIIPMFA